MSENKTPEFNPTKSNFGVRGWLFVIYSFLVMLLTTIVSTAVTNLALPTLCEKYGWNYANMISLGTVFSWSTSIFIFFCGRLLRKGSPKKGALLLGAVYTTCVFIFPRITASWQYAIVYGSIAIFSGLWYNQFNAIITSNWFPRKKGLVIGWTTIGLPLGGSFGVKIYYALFGRIGMNGVFYLYAGIGLVCVLMCLFLVTDYPEQCGCFPDNDRNMTTEEAKRIMAEGMAISEKSIWTNKRLLKTKEVWLLSLSLGLQMLFTGGFMGVMVPRLTAIGYDPGTAVNLLAFAGVMGACGSYVVGWIDQKTNPKVAILIVHGFAIASCLMNIIPNKVCVIISLVLLGMVLGGAANNLVSSVSTMWGRYGFVRAHTIVLIINQLIGASGSMLVAQVSARWSYTGSYLLVACLAVVGIFLIMPVKLDSIKNYEIAEGCDISIR